METGTITPVMNVGNDGNLGGGGGIWIFALLILMAMFNGGFGFGGSNFANAIGYENLATQAQVDRGFDNQNLQAQTRDILTAVNTTAAATTAAVNQAKYDNINVAKDIENLMLGQIGEIKVAQANALANQNQCCCETRLEMANQTAATNANLTAQIQSVKDMIAQDKIEGLQAQVQALQLAQATAGVLRFPTSWSYGAGAFPPIFGGCNCGNI